MKPPAAILCLALIAAPGLGAGEVLDLERVIAMALERNPTMKSIEEQRDEVEAGVREAWADVYPQLAFRGSWDRSRNPSLLNSADFEDILEFFPDFKPSIQELNNLSLELSQPLYQAGKIGAGVKLAKIVVEITDALIETAQLDAGLIAAEAYFRFLEANEGLATIEIQRQARRESLAVVEARYELGDATELERLQAKAVLAELEPVVKSAEGSVRVAEIDLRAILDLEEAAPLQVEEISEPLPALPGTEPAMSFAFENRPEFRDLEKRINALDKQKRITKADGYPQLNLNGFYGRTASDTDNLDDELFADWFVGIGLRWEFFDGGRRRSQVAQLDSQQDQIGWQLAGLRNQVEQQVESALVDYETALSRWQAAEVSAQAAREASRVAQENYQEGVALQTDWLTAQEREVQAEVVRVQSYYGARLSAARMARAVGLQADVAWRFTGSDKGETP
jgi:outer membrane protein TolC